MCEHCPLLTLKEFKWRFLFEDLRCPECGRRFEIGRTAKVVKISLTALMCFFMNMVFRDLINVGDWVFVVPLAGVSIAVIVYALRFVAYAAYAASWAEAEQKRRNQDAPTNATGKSVENA